MASQVLLDLVIVVQRPHLLQLAVDIGETRFRSQCFHLLQTDLRDILLELGCQTQALLSLLRLPILPLVEIHHETVVFEVGVISLMGLFGQDGTFVLQDRSRLGLIDGECLFRRGLVLEEGVFEGFLPADAVVLADGEALGDEVEGELGKLFAICDLLGIDGVDELQFVGGHPGRLAVQHLIEDESH